MATWYYRTEGFGGQRAVVVGWRGLPLYQSSEMSSTNEDSSYKIVVKYTHDKIIVAPPS